MTYRSEQERLADLIGGPVEGFDQTKDGADMIWEDLKGKIKVDEHKIQEIQNEIENSGQEISRKESWKQASSSEDSITGYPKKSRRRVEFGEDISVEDFMLDLYDVHEGLIHIFESLDFNSPLANKTIENINKLGSSIRLIGGVVEDFEPIDHISGLSNPDSFENIEKVINTTKKCYKIGNIESISGMESDNKYGIQVVFSGYDKGSSISYKVVGEVLSDCWEGNEAIDYVYTPEGGKLSVKSYEKNRWIDKSFKDDSYIISWDLEERMKDSVVEKQSHSNDIEYEDDELDLEYTEEYAEEYEDIHGKEVLNNNKTMKVDEEEIENKILNNEKGNLIWNSEEIINEDFPIIQN